LRRIVVNNAVGEGSADINADAKLAPSVSNAMAPLAST
jgi:hypothetical protein